MPRLLLKRGLPMKYSRISGCVVLSSVLIGLTACGSSAPVNASISGQNGDCSFTVTVSSAAKGYHDYWIAVGGKESPKYTLAGKDAVQTKSIKIKKGTTPVPVEVFRKLGRSRHEKYLDTTVKNTPACAK